MPSSDRKGICRFSAFEGSGGTTIFNRFLDVNDLKRKASTELCTSPCYLSLAHSSAIRSPSISSVLTILLPETLANWSSCAPRSLCTWEVGLLTLLSRLFSGTNPRWYCPPPRRTSFLRYHAWLGWWRRSRGSWRVRRRHRQASAS